MVRPFPPRRRPNLSDLFLARKQTSKVREFHGLLGAVVCALLLSHGTLLINIVIQAFLIMAVCLKVLINLKLDVINCLALTSSVNQIELSLVHKKGGTRSQV